MRLYEVANKHQQYAAKPFFKNDDVVVKKVLDRGAQVASYIKKNCKNYLEQVDNGSAALYRGFTNSNGTMAFTKKVRTDRIPLTSSEEEHESFNVLISLGEKKANRSNSLFCTGDEDMASEYGDEYVIFPIGKFSYTWHPKYEDWYGNVDYEQLLTKKDKKVNPSEIAAKKELWKKEYESNAKKALKTQQTARTYADNFFSKYGIKLNKNSYDALTDWLTNMFGNYYTKGTMHPGTAKNPFPNVDSGITATLASYNWQMDKVKSAPLQKLFMHLKKASTKEKGIIRKGLQTCKTKLKASQKSDRWLIIYPTVEEFIKEQEFKIRKESRGNTWIVKKDPISALDKDNPKLRRFLEGLRGDDGTLAKGIKAECEIMIACNTVLAIEPNFYADIVLPMLRNKKPKISTTAAANLLQGHNKNKRGDW